MAFYLKKSEVDILRNALEKLQGKTPFTSIGPGSIVRSLSESVVKEISSFYKVLDFNMQMSSLATARGRALDQIGALYDAPRKTLSKLATIDSTLGAFYFFLTDIAGQDITIPRGTKVYTSDSDLDEQRFTYLTTENVTIPAGRLRAYCALQPQFQDSIFTTGKDTLVNHNFSPPPGVEVNCTNPKPIAPQTGLETDDNYRRRIIAAARSTQGGTSESLRFAALSVEGVREVKIRNNPYGFGTVEVIVVPEDNELAEPVLANATEQIRKYAPVGVRVRVVQPTYVGLNISVGLILDPRFRDFERRTLIKRAEIAIKRYVNGLMPGDQLVYVQFIQAILDSTDVIRDVSVSRLSINGSEVLRRNYQPRQQEQIIPGSLEVSILD